MNLKIHFLFLALALHNSPSLRHNRLILRVVVIDLLALIKFPTPCDSHGSVLVEDLVFLRGDILLFCFFLDIMYLEPLVVEFLWGSIGLIFKGLKIFLFLVHELYLSFHCHITKFLLINFIIHHLLHCFYLLFFTTTI